MEKILIVDDEQDFCFNLSTILKEEGFDVIAVGNGRRALKTIQDNHVSLVLLDIRLPDINGIDLLEKIKQINKDLNVIMLTADEDVQHAFKAMKRGAFDYITKPFNTEELLLTIKRACENIDLQRELKITQAQLEEQAKSKMVQGESPASQKVLKQVRLVAPTLMTVILQGESGVGKELIANLIHQYSDRRDKPFVPVDCGTIPDLLTESILFGYEKGAFTGADNTKEGQFECADKGTIFLDEIINTSESVQMKLLRVVQEKKLRHLGGKSDIPVDVRIITASNVNLTEAVKAGKLRADLYHRLNEFVINVPPLRERRDDIPALANQFLMEANREMGKNISRFSSAAIKLLVDAPWPGNVRELKNAVKKAVLIAEGETITPAEIILEEKGYFIAPVVATYPDNQNVSMKDRINVAREEVEKRALQDALRLVGGNKAKAARMLKIDRTTLYTKIKKYALQSLSL
jgi:DNA-binding NtrC family response regulator